MAQAPRHKVSSRGWKGSLRIWPERPTQPVAPLGRHYEQWTCQLVLEKLRSSEPRQSLLERLEEAEKPEQPQVERFEAEVTPSASVAQRSLQQLMDLVLHCARRSLLVRSCEAHWLLEECRRVTCCDRSSSGESLHEQHKFALSVRMNGRKGRNAACTSGTIAYGNGNIPSPRASNAYKRR